MIHWLWANLWYFYCNECFLRNHALKMKDILGYRHILLCEEVLVSSFLSTRAALECISLGRNIRCSFLAGQVALRSLPVISRTIASVQCYKAYLIMSVSLDYKPRVFLPLALSRNRGEVLDIRGVQKPILVCLSLKCKILDCSPRQVIQDIQSPLYLFPRDPFPFPLRLGVLKHM